MASLSLVFDLLARDRASAEFRNVGDAAERAGRQGEGFGSSIGRGMAVAGAAIAAAGIGAAFVGFVKDAQESAKISRLTEQVVKSTSGAANITAQQVNALATAISNKTAVDDEQIQSASNLLLTFTKVRNETGKGNDIFNQATQAAVDMSVALGTDANGAALQLGKALNDPIKGVTALSRAGVSFTQQQKDQIKAMVEAGDTLGAQKIILGEMQVQFGGAAAAAADPLERLKVIAGNLGEEIGGALLPYVERFATYAVDTLLPNIRKLGGWIGDNLVPIFVTVRDVVGQVYDIMFKGDFTGGPLQEDSFVVDALFRIREGAQWLAQVFTEKVLPAVRDAFRWLQENALPIMETVWQFLRDTFQPAFEALVDVWNDNLKPALADLWAAFKDLMPIIGAVVAVLGFLVAKFIEHVLPIIIKVAGFLIENFAGAFRTAAGIIRTVYDTVIAPVFSAFLTLVQTVRDGFGAAVDGIGRMWAGIKSLLSAPVQWVIDVVWNNGLRALWNTANNLWGGADLPAFTFGGGGGRAHQGFGMASGGVLPGYTPGRDVHRFWSPTGGRLDLSGGEAVMRPEFTRALGVPTINHLNEIARQSGERGLMQALGLDGRGTPGQAFAGGGIVNLPGWLSTALKFLPGGGAISAIADRVNGSIGGQGGGEFGSMVLGMAKNMGAKVVEKMTELFGSSGGSGRATPNGVGGLGPAARAAHEFVRQNWGFTGTIGGYAYRNIAGTNQLSKHALGKAIDVMVYRNFGLGQAIADFFAGPGRGRFGVDNVIWNRRIHSGRGWGPYFGASPHIDHPHIDFYKTGTLSVPHDGLAYLHKGERVIPAEQNKPGGTTYINVTAGERADEIARAIEEQQRIREFLHA